MKLGFLIFIFSLLVVFYISSDDANADTKLCTTNAECGANSDCACGACMCQPQWYNCDADFSNGCENHYECDNVCTPNGREYCVDSTNNDDGICSKGVWGYGQGMTCGMSMGLDIKCGVTDCSGAWGYTCDPNPYCLQTGLTASCVECRTDADCTGGKRCDSTHTCKTPDCECIDDNTKCGVCSTITPGSKCVNIGGSGVLIPKHPDCNKECVKIRVLDGSPTDGGGQRKVPEICFDSYDAATGNYENYLVDAYGGAGQNILETGCVNGVCGQTQVGCPGSSVLQKQLVVTSKLPSNIPAIPANTYSYYCWDTFYPPSCNYNSVTDNGETDVDCGGGGCPACPAPCTVCGGLVCAGECVPGEAPYRYDAACTKVSDCTKCGCAPSEYGGCAKTCSGGFCGYDKPPPCVDLGTPPDCPLVGPDTTYTKTYTQTTQYLISGNDGGNFAGYNRTDSAWQIDGKIGTAANVASNSAPAVFFNGGNVFMIAGRGSGAFTGYNWTGSSWANYNAVTNGLTGVGADSKPSIFYMNGKWNMIAGNSTGEFSGFTFDGTSWAANDTLVSGLISIGSNSAPAVFSKEGHSFMISGIDTGNFYGYNWTGSGWQADDAILSGIAVSGTFSSPHAYYNDSTLYLIVGYEGSFSGYNWMDSAWQSDPSVINGLGSPARASPAVFSMDESKTKTLTYKTRFAIERTVEYPGGSGCFQNKTNITIPEGQACRMNIYANTTHSWGVRLKTTTTPGKTLVQDPFNVCGYINESIYGFCTPTGFGGTPICTVNQTPTLQAGTYEFGIVSSSGVASNQVSKACAYITQCSDCENPYADYYCDLCTKDTCNDGIQNCDEPGPDPDCGGTCASGKETDNNYFPVFVFSQPFGFQNLLLFPDTGGINCVDGIDNDKDCLTDCEDPDCVTSKICTTDNAAPTTAISFDPVSPNAKGWYVTRVNATLTCDDLVSGSGCAATSYRINNGEWITALGALPITFSLNSDDTFVIDYYSEDVVGNVEAIKSATVRIRKSPPFSLRGDPDLIVPLGETGQVIFKIKNLMDFPDIVNISIFSLPNDLHHWTWLSGHRYDENRFIISIPLQPNEERSVSVDVFGGKAPYGGEMNIIVASENIGVVKSIIVNIDIVYSEDGMNVETPEFGWFTFILIAILGAMII